MSERSQGPFLSNPMSLALLGSSFRSQEAPRASFSQLVGFTPGVGEKAWMEGRPEHLPGLVLDSESLGLSQNFLSFGGIYKAGEMTSHLRTCVHMNSSECVQLGSWFHKY